MNKVPKKYEFAVIATDIVIFTVQNNRLKTLLIKMNKDPYKGAWASPGGLVKPDESVNDAALRILWSKAGISNAYMEQLYTFGRVDRDPFGRVVSVAYFVLVPNGKINPKTTDEYADIAWFDLKHLPKLAYDHKEIILTAVERLKSKLEYTNIAYSLLPNEFTFTELQTLYETVLDHKFDKRNFRKKIVSLKIVKKLNKKKQTGPNRPAALYSFTNKKLQLIDIL